MSCQITTLNPMTEITNPVRLIQSPTFIVIGSSAVIFEKGRATFTLFLGDTTLGAERDLDAGAVPLSAISRPPIRQTDVQPHAYTCLWPDRLVICAARCSGKLPRPEPPVHGPSRVIAFGASNVAPAGAVVAGLVIVVSYAGFASPLAVIIAFVASAMLREQHRGVRPSAAVGQVRLWRHQGRRSGIKVGGQEYGVGYAPAESDTGMFGGNSNWRGPVWFPIKVMLIRALLNLHVFFGDGSRSSAGPARDGC